MSKRRIVREGYLTKSPPPDKLMAKWHERFFVLWSSQVMEYYTTKDKRAQDYCKSIDLGYCDNIHAPFRIGNRDFVIKVRLSRPKDRNYLFDCGNESNMKAWLEALNSVCNHVTASEGQPHPLDRALPEVPTTPEVPSSDEEDATLYDECLGVQQNDKMHIAGSYLPRQHQGGSSDEDETTENYEELDDMQAPVIPTQRPPLKLPSKVLPPSNSAPLDSRKRPPMPPPKPQAASCDDETCQQENYEELDDMQAPVMPTQRPPLKLPSKVLPPSNSAPLDSRKRPPMPPPKPQAASCDDETCQQENYEELDDMQAPVIPTQRPPLKLPTKVLPHSNSNGSILQPGPETKKWQPSLMPKPQSAPTEESDQQENYTEMNIIDTRKRPPVPRPKQPQNVSEHEPNEPLNMTMKKPLSNPVLMQALDAVISAKGSDKKTPGRPNHPLVLPPSIGSPPAHREEGELIQDETYEPLEMPAPPIPSRNVAPPSRDGQGSRPSPYEDQIIQKTYDDTMVPQAYEEPASLYPNVEHVTNKRLTAGPLNTQRQVDSGGGSTESGQTKVKRTSRDDDTEATGFQERVRGKPTHPQSSISTHQSREELEDGAPPDVPKRVESISQSGDGPLPPPRTTSIPLDEDELSKKGNPPVPPARNALTAGAGDDLPKQNGSSLTVKTFPGQPPRNPALHPLGKSSPGLLENVQGVSRAKSPQSGVPFKSKVIHHHSDLNLVPPEYANTHPISSPETPPTVDTPGKQKLAVRPQIMPRPSTPVSSTSSPRQPELPVATPTKPRPQPVPKPRVKLPPAE